MTKTGQNLRGRAFRAIMRTAWLAMVISPLFSVTACNLWASAKPNVKHEIPESLLTCRQPRTLPPADTATQADVDAAMTDIYLSWEATCDNLEEAGQLMKKAPL